ncbi:MAG: cell division protein FtsZ [Bosea sp. (in: a-proteobacteria)]
MAMNLQAPDIRELKPRITVFGVGGGGGNAVNNMIQAGLQGVDFVVANTDAQALAMSSAQRIIQMGLQVTEGLGAGSQPEIGRAAAEEVIDEIRDHLAGAHMVFITAGMGGGTGTGAAPVVARAARELGILTVGVVTKPFQFEGTRRLRMADAGIQELQASVDTLIVIPNQNLFRIANENTGFADAFGMADQVLYSGVACITDLMVKPGLINLDFADVRAVMRGMGKAMMGTGEATGEKRAETAAQAAISNPLLDEVSMRGARGLLISITGGRDMKLYEVDEAATRIREQVDEEANIIVGATFDESMEGVMRVSVVATGIDAASIQIQPEVSAIDKRIAEVAERLKAEARLRAQSNAAAPAFRPMASVITSAPVQPAPQPMIEVAPMEPTVIAETVRLEPAQPRVVLASAPPAAETAPMRMEEPLSVRQDTFIPPEAERIKPARLPRVEDLPRPAQNEIAARNAPQVQQPAHSADSKRMSLMQRLASVGFGRRDDAPAATEGLPASAPRVAAAPATSAPSAAHAEYMRRAPQPAVPRAAEGQLDTRGRAPAARNVEDDQLEIPAFLRRQSN